VVLAMDREPSAPPAAEEGWHDPATGLFGPSVWAAILATESARCRRYGRTATVVAVEVPELEGVATAWGEDVRSVAITKVGRTLRSVARSSDYVARTGERRFAVILPETDEVAAVNFIERARERCDAVLPRGETVERCRFGWADARRSRSLDAAATVAAERLTSDR
jgi:diguanylate cyclase (GGDEF)-like protein